MEQTVGHGLGALTQLRAFLAQRNLPQDSKLPPERELVELLGISRGQLRRAMEVLEREGELWRHVGKGTFVGARPIEEISSLATIASKTNPAEVMRTRLLFEPMIAREAALNATAEDIADLHQCLGGTTVAKTWRVYETWDNRLHRTIAHSAHNGFLLSMFDTLNTVRRTVSWGRLRPNQDRPAADHHSFAEHDRIVAAIENRDLKAAECAMRGHLTNVAQVLLGLEESSE